MVLKMRLNKMQYSTFEQADTTHCGQQDKAVAVAEQKGNYR